MIFRFEVEFENQMQERNRRLGFCSHLYAKSLTNMTTNELDHGKGMS